ncbi:MAG: valine--tRNA ligase [Candidatus Uhrbacteria bacterium]|nr:valine--tRNA ligase [Candidatus Uhrbacteria bacterium]
MGIDQNDISKAYEAQDVEDNIYSAWEKSGYFTPENLPDLEDRKEAFTIVLPPPNVTGTLHIGHAVMLAIEDAMVRFARMRGKRVLWIPGTDHAAIATQAKVEKLLIKDGLKDPRHDLGREVFLDHVEKFAVESHDTIVHQTKKMGASLDWSREAYTLDEDRSLAVRTVFKMMYDDGLIYRGDRVINWCPRCKSTLADDEVEYKEGKTPFYYFKYGPVVIATARPETKFLDKTIVVHPLDKRYKDLVGSEFEIEWIDGKIKAHMIADEAAYMELGSGAMTITPAHSLVDFEIAKKHNLPVVKIIDEDGNFTDAAGDFAGKNAHASRDAIVQKLQDKGLVDHIDEDYTHSLSVCYRCSTPIEPLPKVQWFIDVNKGFKFRASKHAPINGIKNGQEITLKELMQHVVKSNQIEVIPDRFIKTYFNWIDNLRDWNISRQIWFGHRVPVWYKGEEVYVGVEAPVGKGWEQDSDTLDTWFSAGLWTFSTLGWPKKDNDLNIYHPTQVLETGYDIIFFWVARMILMTTYALGEVPFKQVYLHGLVRDEQGRKMSKSLDNVIDPLDTIKQYGADATRLALMIGSTPGSDSKLSLEKIGSYRNFTNKLWNISRFAFMNVDEVKSMEKVEPKTLADRWVLGRFAEVVEKVTGHMEKYEFSLAGEMLRDFTWNEFADWYLEIAKVQKTQVSSSQNLVDRTDDILLYILERLLIMWHPFMPFVTEEIYKQFDSGMLIVAKWPDLDQNPPVSPLGKGGARWLKKADREAFEGLQGIIIAIRNTRARYKVNPGKKLDVTIASLETLDDQVGIIKALAKVSELTLDPNAKKPEGAAAAVSGKTKVYIPLADLVDFVAERKKLEAELADLMQYVGSLEGKLKNQSYTKNAPADVVSADKLRLEDASNKVKTLKVEIDDLPK